jgi:hypothetical protein
MFGYFRRLRDSLAAMVIGFVLIPISVVLHGWNEYRTVHRTRGLAEARRLVSTIPHSHQLAQELDNRLVHLSGKADTEEILADDRFNVRQRAIHLRRTVEMYQWTEKEIHQRGSQDNSRRTFEYERIWSSSPIDSTRFQDAYGHDNPGFPFESRTLTAEHAFVGVYQLNDFLKQSMNEWQAIPISQETLLETIDADQRENYLLRNSELFISRGPPEPDRPRIGDLRILFSSVQPAEVSLVAQMRGNSFAPFKTSNGENIQKLYLGKLTAEEVMDRLDTENTTIAWMLRMGGVFLSILGFVLCLRPLSAVVSFVPLLGSLTSGLLFLVAMLLGGVVSLTTIGMAWIAVRPLLGISALALAAAGVFAIVRLRNKNQVNQQYPLAELADTH